jgi:hypothetical protein
MKPAAATPFCPDSHRSVKSAGSKVMSEAPGQLARCGGSFYRNGLGRKKDFPAEIAG